MSSSSIEDHTAERFGGWARLCDPAFSPSAELYAAFHEVGMTNEQFDTVRTTEIMPARQRVMLDVSETLLNTWARYLCGLITPVYEAVVRSQFIDLPLASFWREQREIMREHELARGHIEDFIQSLEKEAVNGSIYYESRVVRIRTLARLIREHPRPAGPDCQTAPVPLRPYPPNDGTSLALALPQCDEPE